MKRILSLLLLSSSIFSMQLERVQQHQEKLYKHDMLNALNIKKVEASVFVPERLGSAKLYHGDKGFYVHHDDKMKRVQKCFVDPMVRNITPEQLKQFIKVGRFALNRMNDGEFSLKANGNINGGGPMFGGFMYWATKSVCYGALAAATATTVIATGGAVAGAIAGGAAAGGAIGTGVVATAGHLAGTAVITAGATATTGAAITTTAGIGFATATTVATVTTGGAGTVAAAIGGSTAGIAITKGTVLATSGLVASGVKGSMIVAGIESLSLAVGTLCGMAPTL